MPEVLLSGFCLFESRAKKGLNIMKKMAIFYNAALGIFWEVAYAIVIIGIGALCTLAIKYLR
jgi:hypothetical protein